MIWKSKDDNAIVKITPEKTTIKMNGKDFTAEKGSNTVARAVMSGNKATEAEYNKA